MTARTRIASLPEGTYGLAVAPWTPGEVYAVAARWGEASAPVYTYGLRGWVASGRQVADYRHRPEAALAGVLSLALQASGEPEDRAEEEAARLVSDAWEI